MAAWVEKETGEAAGAADPAAADRTLEELEKTLSFEDIRYFRCLADVQIQNSPALRDAAKKVRVRVTTPTTIK